MTNKALFFGYVAVLSVQFRAAAFCGVRESAIGQGRVRRSDVLLRANCRLCACSSVSDRP